MNIAMLNPSGRVVIRLAEEVPTLAKHVWIRRTKTSALVFRVVGKIFLGTQYGLFDSEKDSRAAYKWTNEILLFVKKENPNSL